MQEKASSGRPPRTAKPARAPAPALVLAVVGGLEPRFLQRLLVLEARLLEGPLEALALALAVELVRERRELELALAGDDLGWYAVADT